MSINLKDYSSMFKLSSKPKKLKETEKPNSLFTLTMFEKYNNTDDIFFASCRDAVCQKKNTSAAFIREKSSYKNLYETDR